MQRLCQPRALYMLAVCGSPDSVEMSPVTQCVTPHFKVQHASENLNLDFYNLLESALYRCNRTTHAYRAYESPGGLLPRWLARRGTGAPPDAAVPSAGDAWGSRLAASERVWGDSRLWNARGPSLAAEAQGLAMCEDYHATVT